ncbi:MAG: hypothetical protein JNK33_06780 [Candidatus Doudnabacteria bacterium]|nr:hypothetical protein [Candidatus Doudnabacteria bacterium]
MAAGSINNVFGKGFVLTPVVKLGFGAIWMALGIASAIQVGKLDEKLSGKPAQSSILKYIVPPYYTAFTMAKYAPDKTPQNAWKHTLGQIFFPSTYTALQLAKLQAKAEGKPTSSVTVTSIMFDPSFLIGPAFYTYQEAKKLTAPGGTRKLNLISQGLKRQPYNARPAGINTPSAPSQLPVSPLQPIPL